MSEAVAATCLGAVLARALIGRGLPLSVLVLAVAVVAFVHLAGLARDWDAAADIGAALTGAIWLATTTQLTVGIAVEAAIVGALLLTAQEARAITLDLRGPHAGAAAMLRARTARVLSVLAVATVLDVATLALTRHDLTWMWRPLGAAVAITLVTAIARSAVGRP